MSSTELQRLASLERNEGKEELRISVDEFVDDRGKSHRYVSLRIWFKGDGDKWLPTKKGITVRAKEILDVGLALKTALGMLNDGDENRFSRSNRQPTAPNTPERQPTAPRKFEEAEFSEDAHDFEDRFGF